MTVKNSTNNAIPTGDVITSLSSSLPSILSGEFKNYPIHTLDYNNNNNNNCDTIEFKRYLSNPNLSDRKLIGNQIIKRWSGFFHLSEPYTECNETKNLKQNDSEIISHSVNKPILLTANNAHQEREEPWSKYFEEKKSFKNKAFSFTNIVDYNEDERAHSQELSDLFYQESQTNLNSFKSTCQVSNAIQDKFQNTETYRTNSYPSTYHQPQYVLSKEEISTNISYEDFTVSSGKIAHFVTQGTKSKEDNNLLNDKSDIECSNNITDEVNEVGDKIPSYEKKKLSFENSMISISEDFLNHKKNEKESSQIKTRRYARSMSTCLPSSNNTLEPFLKDVESKTLDKKKMQAKVSQKKRTKSLDNSVQLNNNLFDVKERIQKPHQFLSVKACEINIESHKNLRIDNNKVCNNIESQEAGTDKSGKGNNTTMGKGYGFAQSISPGSYFNYDKNFKPLSQALSNSNDSNIQDLDINSIERVSIIESKKTSLDRKISSDNNQSNSIQEFSKSFDVDHNTAQHLNFLNQGDFDSKQYDEVRKKRISLINNTAPFSEPFVPRSAYLRKRLEEITQKNFFKSFTTTIDTQCDTLMHNDSNVNEGLSEHLVSNSSNNLFSQYLFKNSEIQNQEFSDLRNSFPQNTNSNEDVKNVEFKSNTIKPNINSETETGRNFIEKYKVDESKMAEPLMLSIEKYKKNNSLLSYKDINLLTSKGNESNKITHGIDNVSFCDGNIVDEKDNVSKSPLPVFGAITKITSTKISKADEIVKSFSDKNKQSQNKNAFSEDSVIKGNLKNDILHEENNSTNHSEKHDYKEFNGLEHEKQKKHSLSSIFSFRKDKESSQNTQHSFSTSFDSGQVNSSVIEPSVTSPHGKTRRSSFFRLFHRKSIDHTTEPRIDSSEITKLEHDTKILANEPITSSITGSNIIEKDNFLRDKVNLDDQSIKKDRVSKSLSITVNRKQIVSRSESQESIEVSQNNITVTDTSVLSCLKQDNNDVFLDKKFEEDTSKSNLSVPLSNQMFGSQDSVYDSETSTKRYSKNKERIKNRKAAKSVTERAKSLTIEPGDMEIDFSNAAQVGKAIESVESIDKSNIDSSSIESSFTPRSTRKKHKARRSNTEFITNVPEICLQPSTPVMTRDDGVVLRRNNRRNNRQNRPKTLLSGLDSDIVFSEGKNDRGSGVINENLSFAEIKKKLLEGLPDNTNTNISPEKINPNERQKIKRTRSTKRYKTITEGIAPRDLELAKQAAEAAQQQDKNRESLNKETFQQITAALMSNADKRKSFLVEDHSTNLKSNEELGTSRSNLSNLKQNSEINPPTMLKRTKSMTTINININVEDSNEEIKPLSEVKNRFLQAMEHTKQKHLTKKTPIDLNSKVISQRERPYTIAGLDDLAMDKLQNEIKAETEKEKHKQIVDKVERKSSKEILAEKIDMNKLSNTNGEEATQKREKKRYTRLDSKKLFEDLFDDLDDIMNEGVTETDLASALECNPSLHYSQQNLGKKKVNDLEMFDYKNTEDKYLPEREQRKTDNQLSDLDFVSNMSLNLSSSSTSDKRNIRPQRHHKTVTNPIKLLQQRDDLIDETVLATTPKEEKSYSREQRISQSIENKRFSDSFSNRQDLDESAVSALRTTVDFSKTKLRKVEVGTKSNGLSEGFEVTNITNILLQIKGRKKVQTSVVNYCVSSLNSNDCFIVITPKELLCWYGAQANVIEKAKAAEVASRIHQKKEFGCKAFEVIYCEQDGQTDSKIMRMLSEQNKQDKWNQDVLNDEDFEKTIISAYMTYTLCEATDPPELIPVDTHCHRMPSKEILLPNCVFVFDFITEVYVWVGQQTSSQQRRAVQQLALEKFKEGHYAFDLDSSSSNMHHHGKTRKISMSVKHRNKHIKRVNAMQGRYQKEEIVKRAEYAILMLLFEGSEWVIFKEKFCDWPDESRIIRMKGGAEGEVIKTVAELTIDPVDPCTMIPEPPLPKLILESYDIGRGGGNPNGMDGYHVITLDVKTWFVSENNSILLPDESFGQFHSGEGYVIRWQYRIVKVRALRNLDDPLKAGGIERCCYFFWLGNDCSVNEEGATALMTVELDQEKGPQIRVTLGKEPPALLNLFNGGMVIHAGKRPAPGLRTQYTDTSVIRLYCIRGELPNEACLLQVPAISESLRSRSSFILLLCTQGEVFLWHGCCSSSEIRIAATHAAKQLIANHPDEASIASMNEIGLTEIEEGEEPEVFWLALGGQEDYGSLLDEPNVKSLSIRLFQMQSTTGKFISHEIICPSRSENIHCPFPVLQDDLYNVEQPAIFILDSSIHIYVWFGWWPDDDDVGESSSKIRRWGEERKKAMESALLYAEKMDRDPDNMYIVYAGLEPESFIDLFPYWVVQEDITDLQIDMGIEEDKLCKVTEELALFTKEYYTIDELRRKPPPQGIDPTKLEKYLSEESFLEVFHFQKATFYKLPVWQQVNWKKKVGLY